MLEIEMKFDASFPAGAFSFAGDRSGRSFRARFFDPNGQSQRLFKRTHSSILPEVCPEGLPGTRASSCSTGRSQRIGICIQGHQRGPRRGEASRELHPYDFIVDGGGGLWRVQVKSRASFLDGFYKVRILP